MNQPPPLQDRPAHATGAAEEADLLRLARAGDRGACEALVRRHYAGVYRVLVQLCGSPDWAEDLTQDTFAAAWRRLHAFRGDSAVQTWLDRIAYHKYVDGLRRRRRAERRIGRLAEQRRAVPEEGPLERAAAGDRARGLHGAVRSLPEPDRAVIVLHYLRGMTYGQVAAVIGQPVGTVKARLSRALDRLRERLSGSGLSDDRPD
jgi:RNA polymerase sigma-70 factor, ECF subfamily